MRVLAVVTLAVHGRSPAMPVGPTSLGTCAIRRVHRRQKHIRRVQTYGRRSDSPTRRHHPAGDRSRTSTGHARHHPAYGPSVRSGPLRLAKIDERDIGRDGPSKPRDRYVPRRPTEQRTDSRDSAILLDAASSGQAGGGSILTGAKCPWATPCVEILTQGANAFFDLDQSSHRTPTMRMSRRG